MSKSFLDYSGLSRYTTKLKEYLLVKIAGLVPETRTVNDMPLTYDINISAQDVGVKIYESGDGISISDNLISADNSNHGIFSQSAFDALSKEEQGKGTYIISDKVHIYGVEWDGSASTKWVRTDDAALFTDPVPAVNNGTGSSPFDSIYPWRAMTRENRAGGVEVKEPKYWYKWTKTGKTMKLQIADGPVDGFHVDPVNMDRGDGLGELNYSYIGRYHCVEGWKSETNKPQKTSITKRAAHDGIQGLGENLWQVDFAQFWYIGMLYLVEFADWNSQAVIGYGCSDSGYNANNGQTDAMQYHTGTTAVTRDTYGFTQYRNIEGWWDNVYDWLDGCYYNDDGLNVILNPNLFSDNANGISLGVPTDGYPSEFTIPTQEGFEWALFPSVKAGSATTYVTDGWGYYSAGKYICHGGNHNKNQNYGLFGIQCTSSENPYNVFGCRLQERPPKVG